MSPRNWQMESTELDSRHLSYLIAVRQFDYDLDPDRYLWWCLRHLDIFHTCATWPLFWQQRLLFELSVTTVLPLWHTETFLLFPIKCDPMTWGPVRPSTSKRDRESKKFDRSVLLIGSICFCWVSRCLRYTDITWYYTLISKYLRHKMSSHGVTTGANVCLDVTKPQREKT